MKLAIVAFLDDRPSSGVGRKLLAQVRVMEELGVQARLFVGVPDRHLVAWQEEAAGAHVEQVPLDVDGLAGMRSIWAAQARVSRALDRWCPDVVQHRQVIHYPGLGRSCRRFPVVFEINGDDVVELRTIAPRKHLLNVMTRSWHLRRAAGLVAVSHELAERKAFARYGRPTIVVANGVDLSRHELLPPTTAARPRLVFVGSAGMAWHGLDHLLEVARLRPGWDVDVVGPGQPDEVPPPTVHFHGELYGDDLVRVLARADVGVGTLAIDRKGLAEASPLKSRMYLAHGLAVVGGYRDTDFPVPGGPVLQVDLTPAGRESSLAGMDEFVAAWHGRRVPRGAVEHLDLRAKEEQRLRFLRPLAGCP